MFKSTTIDKSKILSFFQDFDLYYNKLLNNIQLKEDLILFLVKK